jgi:hypothetical protein
MPRQRSDVTTGLAARLRMTQGALRAAVILLVVSAVFTGATLLVTARQIRTLHMEISSQCKFDSDLGAAPITVNPATHKASLLGVSIVADSRLAWRGLRCPGTLPPPDPSFVKWARYWKLPAG